MTISTKTTSPASSPLAQRLAQRLTALNLGYAEFERTAGLNEGTVKGIMYGKSASPRADTIYKIARGLGCRIEDLIGEARLEEAPAGEAPADEPGGEPVGEKTSDRFATPPPPPYIGEEPPALAAHQVLDAALDKVRLAYHRGDLELAAQLIRLFQLDLERLKIEREIGHR